MLHVTIHLDDSELVNARRSDAVGALPIGRTHLIRGKWRVMREGLRWSTTYSTRQRAATALARHIYGKRAIISILGGN